jgi:hypothetical protein
LSSHSNLYSTSSTLASLIWNTIKDDKQLKNIIKNPEQISHLSPKDAQEQKAKISIFLYNITEVSSMRNQPQNPSRPPIILNLNLQYLITPLTDNIEHDQILLGKIMQLFAQTPVLHGKLLQGSLNKEDNNLRIVLNELTIEELNKLWTMLSTPYKLCASYTVYPVNIEANIMPDKIIENKITTIKIKKK